MRGEAPSIKDLCTASYHHNRAIWCLSDLEAMFGQPHTMALVTLASMVEEKDRGPWADYVFFEDDEQLRAYMEERSEPS